MTDAFELPLSLVQALAQRAAQTPDKIALRFLADAPGEQAVLSYRDLDQRARTIAAALQASATVLCCCSPVVRTTWRRSSVACMPG